MLTMKAFIVPQGRSEHILGSLVVVNISKYK